ncbi:uncharacterized protein [Asterias amurensis]|uniref:uncharacterized protein n=1 Tax=Asterias amurensis TaxID=7602 RepID=UPI003AB5E898
MEADVRWCTNCKLRGKTKRLKLFQINDELAALLCDNDECVNLGEISSITSRIIHRRSSDIPIRKKRRPNPTPVSTPKMPNMLSRPPGSLPSQSSPLGTSTDSHRLLKTVPSSVAMPLVRLWRNKSALCWLDACMFLLVSCRSLRACLVRLPEKSLIRILCNAFESGQPTQWSSQSGDANSLKKPEECSALNVSPVSSQSTQSTIPSSALGANGGQELCNAKPVQNDQDSTHAITPVGGADHRSVDPLDDVRKELFQKLQTKLSCRLGQEESPVFALPALLKLDGTVEEHFLSRYRWEFYCDQCGHADISVNKKTVITLPSVPADFNMANPTMLQCCTRCQSQSQKSHLVFHSSPACVMLHFQDGLADGDFMKHSRFTQGGVTYTLSAVIRYRRNPNHFVTLLRDPESNHWLEYDDILPSPFMWQRHTPQIPAKEIHVLIWERVTTPCTACIRMQSDVTALLDSLEHSSLRSIQESQHKTNTRQRGDSLRNRKSMTVEHLGSWRLLHQSGPEHHTSDGRINSAKFLKGVAVGELNSSIDHRKVQEAVDLTSSETSTDTTDNGVAVHKGTTPYSSQLLNAHLEARTDRNHCAPPEGPLAVLNSLRLFRPSVTKKDTTGSKQMEPVIAANTGASTKQKPRMRPQSFLEKVHARRKNKLVERDAGTPEKPNTLSVLDRIPQQLLKYSGTTGVRSKKGNTEDDAIQNCTSSRKEMCRTQIPKQLLPAAVNGKLLVSRSEQSLRVTRVKSVDSVRGVSTKVGIFQPYGHRKSHPEPLGRVTQVIAPHQQNAKTVGVSPCTSWQKRVGKFSLSSSSTSKRVRRDSTDENSYADQPKQTWYPSSSVSSPSACSDVSSLSDNQSFASGRDDLAATIEELCKAIGSDYSCTPSVSSRFSSPSPDMFYSENVSYEGGPYTLDNLPNDNHCLLNGDSNHQLTNNSAHQVSEQPGVGHTPYTHAMVSSMHHLSEPSTAHRDTPSLTPHNSTQDVTISTLNYPKETHVSISEETLPSVAQTCPANKPIKPLVNSAMSPSCVPSPPVISTVAMQQELPKPCDSVIRSHAPGSFNSLGDTTTGAIISTSLPVAGQATSDGQNDFDDILMDSKLLEENLDFMETDWSSNFVELLA